MSIRIKHLDKNTPGMKGFSTVSLGDVTATSERIVFVAPVACVVDAVDVYTHQAVNEGTTNSVTINTISVRQAGTSGNILGSRGNSANGVTTTNDINSNTRYRITITGNNSLTVGTPIMLNFSQQGSGVLSGVICHVTYTPLFHRETR